MVVWMGIETKIAVYGEVQQAREKGVGEEEEDPTRVCGGGLE